MANSKKNHSAYLAIDLGASSGRAIIGWFDENDGALKIEELHRFEHLPCPTPSGPVWDLTGIWLNVLQGLREASKWCAQHQQTLASIGVDTWGVDWVLAGPTGELHGLSHCYRDPANVAAAESVLESLGGKLALYEKTGIQHMAINSLFQLVARYQNAPELFQPECKLMFIPDLMHYWLSGKMTIERTIASTSGLLSLESSGWNESLINELGLPLSLFGDIVDPGDVVGNLLPAIAEHTGLDCEVRIIAPGSHDTASAVAAVPFGDTDDGDLDAYLSSGTWSLLGAEISQPFVSAESCAAPFTNERGFDGTVRFLKNIGGLWLVQELRREYVQQGHDVTFAELVEQARLADSFRTLINPNDPVFSAPGGMAARIRDYAQRTNQPEPETIGELVRCCLDSLALCYLDTITQLESILGKQVARLNIVGGGVKNELLSEITCAVLQREVVCGPVEATAIGNLLGQARGLGLFEDLAGMRAAVSSSFEVKSWLPEEISESIRVQGNLFDRYRKLIEIAESS